jgi:hypothetical protein
MFEQVRNLFFTPHDRHPEKWQPAFIAIQLGFLAGAFGLLGRDLIKLLTVDDWWPIIGTEIAFATVVAAGFLMHTIGYAATGMVIASIGGVGSAAALLILVCWQSTLYL